MVEDKELISFRAERLDKSGLTPNQFLSLIYLNQGLRISWSTGVSDLSYLEFNGFIAKVGESYSILEKGINLLIKGTFQENEDFLTFAMKYRKIFSGLKNESMGDRNGVIKKLRKFCLDNPQFSKEVILQAAKSYIETCRADDYKYLQQADYFIQKMDSNKLTKSRLYQYCEQIIEGIEVGVGKLEEDRL